MKIIQKIEGEQIKADRANFNVGDTVKVHTRVIEGGKERIQATHQQAGAADAQYRDRIEAGENEIGFALRKHG